MSPPFLSALLILLFTSAAFTLSLTPAQHLNLLANLTSPSLNGTIPSTPTGAWHCKRGGFSLTKRPHYDHCRTAVSQLPETGDSFPVMKMYRTCLITVDLPEEGQSSPPQYWSWGEIKTEALDLIAACKRQLTWSFWLGGQSITLQRDPIRTRIEFNSYRALGS